MAAPSDGAASGQIPDDAVVGWVFHGFSRPRRWIVAVPDFHGALEAFDRAAPQAVKVLRHEPILNRDAQGYDLRPGQVVELER